MSILDNFSSEDVNTEGDFTIITSDKDRSLQGNIYLSSTGELVSSTFRNSSEISYTTSEDLLKIIEGKEHKITPCYEGAVIKVWLDKEGVPHFSNTKRIDCRTSFWGNKEDKFETLFMENGGHSFMESITPETSGTLTHHFMLMNKNLVITSRIDMRDNETIVIYLGSVDLGGNILEISNIDPKIYHYHMDRTDVLPSKEELSGRILIPTVITLEDASIILTNGFDRNTYEEKEIPHAIFKGESVVIKLGSSELIKVVPQNYEMRKQIAGNTPNIKSQLYNLLEMAKDQHSYSDNFHLLGCLRGDELETILTQDSADSSFIINAFINKEKRFDINSIQDRMSNILTNCILFCPLGKVNTFIEAWMDYQNCRDVIIKFLKRHNHDIRHGKYDEKLGSFHQKALKRIKNLAEISKIYASEKGSQYSYSSRMEYSLKGAMQKEFGPSLYRIEKAIRFLQE